MDLAQAMENARERQRQALPNPNANSPNFPAINGGGEGNGAIGVPASAFNLTAVIPDIGNYLAIDSESLSRTIPVTASGTSAKASMVIVPSEKLKENMVIVLTEYENGPPSWDTLKTPRFFFLVQSVSITLLGGGTTKTVFLTKLKLSVGDAEGVAVLQAAGIENSSQSQLSPSPNFSVLAVASHRLDARP